MALRGSPGGRAPVPLTPRPPAARTLDPLTLAAITTAVDAAVSATAVPGSPAGSAQLSPFAAQLIFGG